ncbi:MAG: GNAT family N-acetyltransferase [Chloroflexi bacterium]|nr:MAG: GNAT family N-acetyltransferase [Chloroflexota bacterium]
MVAIETAAAGRVGLAKLEPSDGELLRRLFYRLSPETIYRRFLSPIVRPEQARPERLLDVDHHDREAVVAVQDGELVGVARYFRRPGTSNAELAVVVADDWQGQGLGTRLLSSLRERAQEEGIERFTLTMQADNRAVLALVRRFWPSPKLIIDHGVYETTVALNEESCRC